MGIARHEPTPPPVGAPSWYGDKPPVLGDFEILDLIGHGAMGAVFKARQRSMDRLVAVKILRPHLAQDPGYVERFLQEARAAARLNHPNIVLALGVGEDHGLYYFAMERVEGHTAKLLLQAGTFDEHRALEIARQVALALDYAWTQEHIVHRDIKPANIIITPKGTVKLADLGLAYDPDLAEQGEKATNGGIVGTPLYIAPEQVARRPDLDVRCDLYALGTTLFHMVTGRPPFEGKDSKAVMAQHLTAPVPNPRDVRPELSESFARILQRLMAKEREDRYPDAKKLVAEIDRLLAPPSARHEAASTHIRPEVRHQLRRRRARRRALLTAGLSIAVLGGAALAISSLRLPNSAGRVGTPTPTHVPATSTPARPSPAMVAYDAAMTYVESHPEDYVTALTQLGAVAKAYPGTEQARLATDRCRELEVQINAKGRQALDEVVRKARGFVAQSRFADALAAFQTFPKNLATESWARQVAAAREAVERDARRRFDTALDKANDLADNRHLDDAASAYQALLNVTPPAWREAVASRLATVRQEQQKATAREKAEEFDALYATYREQLPTLYRTRRYEAAIQLIKSTLAAAPEGKRDELKRELEAADDLVDFWLAVQAGVAGSLNRSVALRGVRGTLAAFKEGVLALTKDDGETVEEALADLPADDLLRFAQTILPDEDLPLATARFVIAEGDADQAEAALKKLEAGGTDLAPLRTRLALLARHDPLKAARADLMLARDALAKGSAQEAATLLRPVLDRLKDSAADRDLLREAEMLLRNATRPKPTYAEDAKPATLRIACDTTCQVLLNGQVIFEGLFRKGQFDQFDLKVKTGDILGVVASGETRSRGLYALLMADEGQYHITTDPSWQWAREAPDDWATAPKPTGKWENALPAYAPHTKPGYADAGKNLEGWWIWGRGARCCFRKAIRLAPTAADQLAEDAAAEKALTAKFGAPVRATVSIACRHAYRLYVSGRLVGAAATFHPEGDTYELPLRHGDVLGVQAPDLEADSGWLDVKVALPDGGKPLRTDRSWVCTTDPPAEDWNARGRPGGAWRAPYFYDADTFRIRGDGTHLYFRKTLDLRHAPPAERTLYTGLLHGRVRVGPAMPQVTYDFEDPDQLADWQADESWTWRKGMVGGTSGSISLGPYAMRDILIEADVEFGQRFSMSLVGSGRRGADDDGSYELRFTDTTRRGFVYLRKRGDSIGNAHLPPARPGTHYIVLKKTGPTFVVYFDKREILTVRDEEPLPADQLSRILFTASPDEKAILRGIRVTGRPEIELLHDDLAARGDRPLRDDADTPKPREGGPPRPPEASPRRKP